MKQMSDFLTELEAYPDLESNIIRTTKIHKVLKQMIKLDNIPLEEEFKFRDRSSKLLAKWNDTLSSETPAEERHRDKSEGKAEMKADSSNVEGPSTVDEPALRVNGDVTNKGRKTEQKEETMKPTTTATDFPTNRGTPSANEDEGRKEVDEVRAAEKMAAEDQKLDASAQDPKSSQPENSHTST